MKFNQWTLGLAAVGVISLASAVQAEEAQHQVMTALSSTTLSGYVDTSASWWFGNQNPTGGAAGGVLPGRAFDGANRQDGFNLDVVKVQLSKPLDEGQWSAGYNVGLLFGPDANLLNTTSTLFGNTSDFAIENANVVVRAPVGNGLDITMGVFNSPIGYESFDAVDDPNFSRSLGYQLEPTVLTGVMASYRFNDILSVKGGVADNAMTAGTVTGNAINQRSNLESLKTYFGEFSLTAPDSMGFLKGAALYGGIIDNGMSSFDYVTRWAPRNAAAPTASNSVNPINFYAGATVPTPLTGLTLGAAYDYRASGLYNYSYENDIAGYLVYQCTEKLKFADRVEYATGSAGAWTVMPEGYGGLPAQPGSATDNVRIFSNTATVDYSLWANVITRAEVRWDHSLTGQNIYGAPNTFGGANERNALTLALNVIYKF